MRDWSRAPGGDRPAHAPPGMGRRGCFPPSPRPQSRTGGTPIQPSVLGARWPSTPLSGSDTRGSSLFPLPLPGRALEHRPESLAGRSHGGTKQPSQHLAGPRRTSSESHDQSHPVGDGRTGSRWGQPTAPSPSIRGSGSDRGLCPGVLHPGGHRAGFGWADPQSPAD